MVYTTIENMFYLVDDVIDRILEVMRLDHAGNASFFLKAMFRVMCVVGFFGFLITGNPVMLLSPVLSVVGALTFYATLILFVEHFFVSIRAVLTFIDSMIDLGIIYGKL